MHRQMVFGQRRSDLFELNDAPQSVEHSTSLSASAVIASAKTHSR
jgi:hypothetical protein